MNDFFRALPKGLKIIAKNYADVVRDIDKQTSELSKLQNTQDRSDVYNYLQRLLKLHAELFNLTWTLLIALISLILSIVALIRAFSN